MSLMGKAKDVYVIPNLPCIISKEGFQNVKLSYLGGMWVLFEFDSFASKENFLNHSGICSWFTELIQATSSFENDERIVWISIEGLPIKVWTPNTFRDVANKADNTESDVDRVSESSFMHENDIAHKDINSCKKRDVGSHSEDPFNIYGIFDGQKNNVCNSCSDELKFPPGFTLDNNDQEKNAKENIKDTTERVQSLSNKLNDRCLNRGFSSQRSMKSHFQKSKALETKLNGDGLRSYVRSRINFACIQETKAESISLHTIKDLWGNQMFDHVVGSSVGYSGGYAFTWAHKSASKMSKLDRYLISEGVLDLFSHLSALCLDRHLYDHRPILLRETNYDYGHSPFRFFHSWFPMEGFNSFVETTWKSLNIVEPNGLIQLKKKLQALKIVIKAWSKEANKRSNDRKINIQQNLSEVDKLIDQGKGNDEILIKRITLLNDLQELYNRNAMKISQKAKIRWSIKDQVQDLERTVTYEEVKRAVWDCGTNKSPGSDGFFFEFYRDVALKVLYKRLYALEMCKSISVTEKMGHPSLSHSFRRMPRGGVKQENYGLLCSKVADFVLPNILDRWCWSLECSLKFSVKSSLILIDNTILLKAEVPNRCLRVVPIKKSIALWKFSTKECSLIR
nr:RNA-directed DNA polymerase, eukaryota [Tanacetum cinerariifolium]